MAEDAVFFFYYYILCICHTFCVERISYDECFAILSILVFCVTYFNIFFFVECMHLKPVTIYYYCYRLFAALTFTFTLYLHICI